MSALYNEITAAWKNDIGFLRILSELTGLSAALWLTGRPLSEACWTDREGGAHPCLTHEPLRRALEEHCRTDRPGIFIEDNGVIYGIMPVGPFSLAIGPAAAQPLSDGFLQAYRQSHGLGACIPIPRKELGILTRYMELANIHFTGKAVAGEEINVSASILEKWQKSGDLEEYKLEQSENDREHTSAVDYENALLRAVKDGDPAALSSLLSGPTPDYKEIGAFSAEQSKEYEYLAVSIITLMTRAAVAGGARTEDAHELGDVYLKRLGRAVLQKQPLTSLSYRAMIDFAELVKCAKEEKSSLSSVDACKAYIEKNLRKNLQISDIAPAIGISRTYLSRLFHEAEGITIQQYIQREKCRHAAQMLQYSDYSIAQIAQYFGFSSQSYFGSCFQAWYGMTPNAYRKENH